MTRLKLVISLMFACACVLMVQSGSATSAHRRASGYSHALAHDHAVSGKASMHDGEKKQAHEKAVSSAYCHHDEDKGGHGQELQSFCSDLCCAFISWTNPASVVRRVTQSSYPVRVIVIDERQTAPPSPPPRG